MTYSDWWRGSSLYQIYPRSFNDSNGDGIGDLGDLRSIIDRLDYMASLGVDGVSLSPFFPSPMRDFGDDVTDYGELGSLFGTLEDFDALVTHTPALWMKGRKPGPPYGRPETSNN